MKLIFIVLYNFGKWLKCIAFCMRCYPIATCVCFVYACVFWTFFVNLEHLNILYATLLLFFLWIFSFNIKCLTCLYFQVFSAFFYWIFESYVLQPHQKFCFNWLIVFRLLTYIFCFFSNPCSKLYPFPNLSFRSQSFPAYLYTCQRFSTGIIRTKEHRKYWYVHIWVTAHFRFEVFSFPHI